MAQVVGLDIGTSAVRAAELDLGSGAPVLVAFGQVGLPSGAIVDGEVQDPSAVADAITRLWQNGKFQSKSVVVGIAGLRAITRELDLPWVPDEDVDSAVRFQSEEVIPFPPDKTILSAQVLADQTAPDGTRTRRVLVAAAHRDLVDGVVGAVDKAGLIVEGVDLVSSALVRALGDPSVAAERPEAIVSIGAGLTVVVVHQHGRPQFVRTIGTGGNAATAAVASALDLPMVDAESLKRRLGEASPQVQSAEQAVQASIAELVGEIRNSVQYFATLPGRVPIARVLLTGGGARLRGLVKELRAQVRIPVEHVSPLARLDLTRIDLDPEQAASIDPVLATPIGLALPEPNASVRKFNLVPPEVTQKAFERQVARKTFAAAGALALVLVGFSAFRFMQVSSAENGVNGLKTNVAQLNSQIPTFDKVVAITNELRTAQTQVASLSATAVDWSAVVSQLGQRIPAGLAINSLTGTSTAAGTAGGTAPAAPASTTASVGTTTAPPGAIGSLALGVGGTFPTTAHFDPVAQWIDGLTASSMFTPPGVASVANAPTGGNTSVTFQSTLWLTADANLTKNAGS
ncbi:MAG TPA: type IV pilus assembly protein PilM [Acidimicrobiales bacterium]|nr:type IV pilus assembly protein PilM [Acidimicrobiales bacterium]